MTDDPSSDDASMGSLNVAEIAAESPTLRAPERGEVEMTVGGVTSGADAVEKLHESGAVSELPAASLIAVDTVAV